MAMIKMDGIINYGAKEVYTKKQSEKEIEQKIVKFKHLP